jgi:hypothetical protein
VGLGAGTLVAACVAAAVLFPPTQPAPRLIVMAVAVVGYTAAADDPRAALATGVLGCLLFDGFLVNQYGELAWNREISMTYLSVFAMAVGVGLGWRWAGHLRVRAAVDAELADLLGTESTKEESDDV